MARLDQPADDRDRPDALEVIARVLTMREGDAP